MARVLVVDDEPDMRLLLRINLEQAGHQVVLAADGEMALTRLAQGHFDLMLLDIMMPCVDGWSVLQELPDMDDPPVTVVLSAIAGPETDGRAHRMGAAAVLPKPWHRDDLLGAVARALGPIAGESPNRCA